MLKIVVDSIFMIDLRSSNNSCWKSLCGVFMFHCFRVEPPRIHAISLRWARVRQAFWKPCAFYVPNLWGKKNPHLTNRTCRHWLVMLTHILFGGLKRGLFKRKGWLEWLAIRKSGLKKNWDWFGLTRTHFFLGLSPCYPSKIIDASELGRWVFWRCSTGWI